MIAGKAKRSREDTALAFFIEVAISSNLSSRFRLQSYKNFTQKHK